MVPLRPKSHRLHPGVARPEIAGVTKPSVSWRAFIFSSAWLVDNNSFCYKISGEFERGSFPVSNNHSRQAYRGARTVAKLTAAVALLGGLISASSPLAGAQTQTKYYDVSVSPSTVYVDAPTPVTVTLENDPSSTQSFGSAELNFGNLPASAVTTSQSSSIRVSPGWNWTVVPSKTSLILLVTSGTLPGIAPSSSLSVTFNLTAPTANPVDVTTEVKQSNDFSGSGNGFVDLSLNPAVITVTPVTLTFVQQPSTVQQSIQPGPLYAMCQPVSVQASAGNNLVNGIDITLAAGSTNPGLYWQGYPVSSTNPITATTSGDGVAVFGTCQSGISATNLGSGYTLSASSPAAASPITSNTFSVVQVQVTCSGNCTNVQVQSSSTGTVGTINTTGSGTYDLIGSFNQGPLECDGQVTKPSTPADPIVVQTTPVSTGASDYALVSMTFPKKVVNSLTNNGTPLMPVCAGATQAFSGSNAEANPIPSVTYPYQGLLPNCTTTYSSDPSQFCVVSRNKNAGASETIEIYVGANYSSDPSFW